MKKIAILGSTGSIGRNALKVIENLNKNGFPVEISFLSAFSNSDLLINQISIFNPNSACVINKNSYVGPNMIQQCRIFKGNDSLLELIKHENYDLIINALVGFSGLIPTIEAINRGKDIALANKESLVVAGELITELAKRTGSKIIPIDSEHSAILQCLQGEPNHSLKNVTLTASGGPFRDIPKKNLEGVTPEQALLHPNWKMGNKITIDSATLMNKGFEIIEGKWLFNVDLKNINVLIHPQSIIHSMVEFNDGSVKAQLGVPDMKIPIQYAITFPERIESDYPRLKLEEIKSLTFYEPDFDKFECLKLAYDVIEMGGSYPVVLNASNEIAIDLFLKKKIKFLDIPYLIKMALNKNQNHDELNIENILMIDRWSRDFVEAAALAGIH